ncbi:hypothetical protein LY76DRAFT_588394 [Colletotrichum caudatum]|nr:hypothetical protein LY76DRAFT_588394 [Colletotrichum caudatum]
MCFLNMLCRLVRRVWARDADGLLAYLVIGVRCTYVWPAQLLVVARRLGSPGDATR